MTTDRLKTLWKAEPFHPFTIHLADGRDIRVRHPELMTASPSGRTIVVFQPDNSMNIFDLLLVTDFEVNPHGHKRSRGRKV
jgi:hypothetical protein